MRRRLLQKTNNSEDGITVNTEYVDMGNGYLWATCNLGATKPEDYGNIFMFGDSQAYTIEQYNSDKTLFSSSNYKWGDYSKGTLTKYCFDSTEGTPDYKGMLDNEDDPVIRYMGTEWKTPSVGDVQWLMSNTTQSKVSVNNHIVWALKSKITQNTLYIPVHKRDLYNYICYISTYCGNWYGGTCVYGLYPSETECYEEDGIVPYIPSFIKPIKKR